VISDLHLEFGEIQIPKIERDVLILAGDVHIGSNSLPYIIKQTKISPVIYVLGNHEFYNHDIDEITKFWTNQKITNLYVLERKQWILDNVRFLGCSLWTEFNNGDKKAMESAKYQMSDYAVIDKDEKMLSPQHTLDIHYECRKWLESQLQLPFSGKTVIITHHLPSYKSISWKFEGNILNYAYYSDLEDIIRKFQPDLWIHGHTHDSFDYLIGKTRVVCNPRGYMGVEINSQFNPSLILEI